MSSASKHVLHEAALWGAAALAGFGLFYFFDDISAALGPAADTAAAIVAQQEQCDRARRQASRARCG